MLKTTPNFCSELNKKVFYFGQKGYICSLNLKTKWFKIILWWIGLLKKYTIEYNSLILKSENETIDYYGFAFLPEFLLKDYALRYIKGRIQTVNSNIVYIERIGDYEYKKQFIY